MDPYVRLIQALAGEEAPQGGPFLLGQVAQCGGGAPLKVSAAGLLLEGEDLLVSTALDWTWMEDSGGERLLRAGDQVALLTADMQSFCLVCKVVVA